MKTKHNEMSALNIDKYLHELLVYQILDVYAF
jgi:hypothetical protein